MFVVANVKCNVAMAPVKVCHTGRESLCIYANRIT